MNSMNFVYASASARRVYDSHTALGRLSTWLDDEQETLERVLVQADRPHALRVLDKLAQLHLEPTADEAALQELLKDAHIYFEILLETLCTMPMQSELETASELPGPEAFETHVRWSGARLQDMLAMLRYALIA